MSDEVRPDADADSKPANDPETADAAAAEEARRSLPHAATPISKPADDEPELRRRRSSRCAARTKPTEPDEDAAAPRRRAEARAPAEDPRPGRSRQPPPRRRADHRGPRAGERQSRHRAGHQGRCRARPHPRRRQAAAGRRAPALLHAQQAQGLRHHGQRSRRPAHGDAVLRRRCASASTPSAASTT